MQARFHLAAMATAVLLFPSVAVAQDKPQPLAADTPSQTVNGNTFVAPKDWTVEVRGKATILTPPENDSHIALVDVEAADADAAVAVAWAAYDAKMKWPLYLSRDGTANDGWDAQRFYSYEVPTNEKRGVGASALQSDSQWTVVIRDMSHATADKRSGQVSVIYDRLFPKGKGRESFAGKTAHKLNAARLDALRDFVEKSRRELGIPGVAVGVVQDGKVILAEGFGVRELGKPDKVNADTVFLIASNTKALTTLMLARLVDQGRFGWNTPVTQLLPGFRLGDDITTQQVLVRHLVCACTGLPRQDMEWWFQGSNATPEITVDTLATMQPTSKFGELYQYSNPMAAAAGFIGGHVLYPDKELGAAYDAAMQSQVFDPLGMDSTTFDIEKALAGNHATPHAFDRHGNTVPASTDFDRPIMSARPAGGAWSSVNNLLKYVQMELEKGLLPNGKRYIGEAPLLERRQQQIANGSDESYGMGLAVDHTWGVPVVHHGGSLSGFRTDMIWLQDEGIGVVVLTNADSGYSLTDPLRRRLLEILFDGKPEAEESVVASAKGIKENFATYGKQLMVPAGVSAVEKLAVHYRNDALGNIGVSHRDGSIWFQFDNFDSEVASHMDDDGTLSFVTISPGYLGEAFVITDKPQGRTLVVRDNQQEYVFEEVK
jgi:CubicO group peptidase (beta-lactamase class C family)